MIANQSLGHCDWGLIVLTLQCHVFILAWQVNIMWLAITWLQNFNTAFSGSEDLLFMRGIQSESIRIWIVINQEKVGSKSEEIKTMTHNELRGHNNQGHYSKLKTKTMCAYRTKWTRKRKQNIFAFNLCQFGWISQHNQPEEIWDVCRTVAQPASQTAVVILKSHLPFNIVPIRSWEWHWCAAHRVYSCCSCPTLVPCGVFTFTIHK